LRAFPNPFTGGLANDASTAIEFPKDSEDQAMRVVSGAFEQDSEIARKVALSPVIGQFTKSVQTSGI